MYKILALTAGVLLLVAGLLWSAKDSVLRPAPGPLPWDIQITQGDAQVLGVRFHHTALKDVMLAWGVTPEIGLFVGPHEHGGLEAYFGRVRLGVLEARVIAHLDTSTIDIPAWAARKASDHPMPSGARKLELSEADLLQAYHLPIVRLTYIPYAQFDAQTVALRFGQPAERLTLNEHSTYWLYPQKGLTVLIDEKGKDVINYVSPRDFPALRQRVETDLSAASGKP